MIFAMKMFFSPDSNHASNPSSETKRFTRVNKFQMILKKNHVYAQKVTHNGDTHISMIMNE